MFNKVKCKWQGHCQPTQIHSDSLDHSSQPRWEEQSDGPQNAHQHKHPEEYSVNHHGNVFPVFLDLERRKEIHSFQISCCISHSCLFLSELIFLDDYFPVRAFFLIVFIIVQILIKKGIPVSESSAYSA